MEEVDVHRCFGGWQRRFTHNSAACACTMTFSVYLPPAAESAPVPAVYWLSGLTCTDENFINKAGAQRAAAELDLALVAPDTSPRGPGVPGQDDGYDLGTGAGFYVNAARPPWAGHYNMYDYVVSELPALIETELAGSISERRTIMGHSMGGHGALVVALRNPDRYEAVSAFAPICAPSRVPWGKKAFGAYLGDERGAWRAWDATALIEDGHDFGRMPTPLVDQGDADQFLSEQLRPDLLEDACGRYGLEMAVRRHAGYDHSYFFIATFIAEHLARHADALA